MKFTKLALTVLCSTLLFCACTKNSDVVIKVNDKEITRQEYDADFDRIKNVQMQNLPKELQKKDSYPMLTLKERYTNDIIVRTLLAQDFEKRNITATKEEIDAKKEQIAKQIGSKEQLEKVLKDNKISQEKFDSDMEAEVKMDKLVDQVVKVKVSDSDIEKFYRENKAQFNVPERVLVSHILIDTNPENIKRAIVDADKEAKLSSANIDEKVKAEIEKKQQLAKEVLAKAQKNPKDFAKLAKQYSQDPQSAEKGGDLGYITKEQMVKEFSDAAFTRKPGVVGPLVKTQFGEHIILVKEKQAAGQQPLSKVKGDLRNYLTQQKKFEGVQKYVEDLKKSADIEYVDEKVSPRYLKKQIDEAIQKQVAEQKKKEAKEKGKSEEK